MVFRSMRALRRLWVRNSMFLSSRQEVRTGKGEDELTQVDTIHFDFTVPEAH